MKPFNLELAKQGHPLITRDGEKIVQFVHLEPPCNQSHSCVLSAVTKTGKAYVYYLEGVYFKTKEHYADLFLDDSIPWKPTLKEGDIIEVYLDNEWCKRTVIKEVLHGIVVVRALDTENYLAGRAFSTTFYLNKYCRKPIESSKITLTINGENIEIDVNNDTLAKIKALL